MDKLTHYRTLIKQILLHHAEDAPSLGQIESVPVFDDPNNQYFLVDFGWDRTGRVHSVILHLRIKNTPIVILNHKTEPCNVCHYMLQ